MRGYSFDLIVQEAVCHYDSYMQLESEELIEELFSIGISRLRGML